MNSLHLTIIHLRENPAVTKLQHKVRQFTRDHFYTTPLVLTKNECIVDSSGEVLARLFINVIPEELLVSLERVARKYQDRVIAKHGVKDPRGIRASVKFGSYVEQGGSGATWTVKNYDTCPGFLDEIDSLGKLVNSIFKTVCVEVAANVASVPDAFKLWDSITLLFWNLTCTQAEAHVDVKDLKWCMVLPFGDFEEGEAELFYLNTKVRARRRDLYLIQSPHVYHAASIAERRQVLVFSNHNAVIQRFCEVDVSNILQKINKNN